MVDIAIVGDAVTFRVAGLHKVWALKSRVQVALRDIVHVEGSEAVPTGFAGWRLPGTEFPGVIRAGSFRKNGAWTFWDVVEPARALVVTLKNHRYARLVVEVARPEEERARLERAVSARRPQSP
jgi:hypothetical protein